ncbi:hypothetical protein FS842_001689 [Serendipita sp. 407]|nr:hypothetical protein FS842_001689 [Serendipita sp. 407]
MALSFDNITGLFIHYHSEDVPLDNTDGAGNVNNPMPNGNGGLAAPTNNPPPPPPPPQAEPQANLVVNWNGPGGSFAGYNPDEHFPLV